MSLLVSTDLVTLTYVQMKGTKKSIHVYLNHNENIHIKMTLTRQKKTWLKVKSTMHEIMLLICTQETNIFHGFASKTNCIIK